MRTTDSPGPEDKNPWTRDNSQFASLLKRIAEAKKQRDQKDQEGASPAPPKQSDLGSSPSGGGARRWEIPYGELKLEQKLGQGTFGEVYSGTYRKSKVAIKLYDFREKLPSEQAEMLLKEANMMEGLRSEYLVGFRGICLDPRYCLVMEFCEGGTLRARLDKTGEEIAPLDQLRWAMQISYGLYQLHSVRIVHRDLKGENILLDKMNHAKVADFGLSIVKSHSASHLKTSAGRSGAGTIPWMAPELHEDKSNSKETDVYSLGVVLWEIVSRKMPYAGLTVGQMISKTVQGKRDPLPSPCPEMFRLMITACWNLEAKQRPTAEQVGDQFAAVLKSMESVPALVMPSSLKPTQASSNDNEMKNPLAEAAQLKLEKTEEEKRRVCENDVLSFKKFEKDFDIIYQKITELPRFDAKVMQDRRVLIHKNLIYQLIWTVTYLLEASILNKHSDWLKSNFQEIMNKLYKITLNIKEVDPKLLEKINELKTSSIVASRQSWGEWIQGWTEDIFSLGGGVIRDIDKMRRENTTRLTLTDCSFRISENNDEVISQTEDYEQYVRETIFFRNISSVIAEHNRLQAIKKIGIVLTKSQDKLELTSEREKLLREQKDFEKKEAEKKETLGDESYGKLLIQRKTRLQKARVKMDLDLLKSKYIMVSQKLYFDEEEINFLILEKINSLQKSLSKILPIDDIELNYQESQGKFKLVHEIVNQLIDHTVKQLSTLDEKKQELPQQLVKLDSSIVTENNFSMVEILKDFDHKHQKLTNKYIERRFFEQSAKHGKKSEDIGIVMSDNNSMTDTFEIAYRDGEYKKMSSVKKLHAEYMKKQSLILGSGNPEEKLKLKENEEAFKRFLDKSTDYFLSCSPDFQDMQLFGFDADTSFDENDLRREFRALLFIFHPDKNHLSDERLVKQIVVRRDALLQHLKWVKIGSYIEKLTPKILEQLEEIQLWFESFVLKKTFPKLSVFNEQRYLESNTEPSNLINSRGF